ncbi:hypothetical protein D9M68_364080 [compost metagenome]
MQLFINNWQTTLTAPLAPGGGAVHVAAEQAARLVGLGAGAFYAVTLALVDDAGRETAWEILRATAVDGGQVTVTREQEGTVALSAPVGARVSVRPTSGTIAALFTALAALTDRVAALEGDGGVPANALTNQAGEVLTSQAGDILTMGD